MSIDVFDEEAATFNVSLVGQKIKEIRLMTDKEMESNGWNKTDEKSAVIILENGIKLYASCDYEGNSAGAIFGQQNDIYFTVYPD